MGTYGVDCYGDDLRNGRHLADPDECCALCSADSSCHAWTVIAGDPQQCYLKSRCSQPQSRNAISGGAGSSALLHSNAVATPGDVAGAEQGGGSAASAPLIIALGAVALIAVGVVVRRAGKV